MELNVIKDESRFHDALRSRTSQAHVYYDLFLRQCVTLLRSPHLARSIFSLLFSYILIQRLFDVISNLNHETKNKITRSEFLF